MKLIFTLFNITIFAALHTAVLAGDATVEKVDVIKSENGTYRFSVTVRHDDAGWEHYANKWEILSKNGTVYGTRILHHPHENEQPFRRSLGAVEIPENVRSVIVRANDSVHGAGGQEMIVTLPN
jgi:hypothetical protein